MSIDRPGHTRISRAALTHTVQAVASTALEVPGDRVSVQVQDDDGGLAVQLSTPMSGDRTRSVYERIDTGRQRIGAEAERITGSKLSRIDVTVTGLLPRTRAVPR
ncbi:hypothetical protein [Tersicoccus sp. Bi-70]|uniref:hypothetical protein n=1 Tax=Tersicoccus sp. Bi-70 TaxID=1897634 RepID=UPI00097708E8|nr:hypothetical protein [Tersicoccus sp. Bi-70]OMH34081.1 hypothetical protein BGP79_02625 [Tersicoccus sp. Bi-70]